MCAVAWQLDGLTARGVEARYAAICRLRSRARHRSRCALRARLPAVSDTRRRTRSMKLWPSSRCSSTAAQDDHDFLGVRVAVPADFASLVRLAAAVDSPTDDQRGRLSRRRR